MHVFEGDATDEGDKVHLVLPVLGLYAGLYAEALTHSLAASTQPRSDNVLRSPTLSGFSSSGVLSKLQSPRSSNAPREPSYGGSVSGSDTSAVKQPTPANMDKVMPFEPIEDGDRAGDQAGDQAGDCAADQAGSTKPASRGYAGGTKPQPQLAPELAPHRKPHQTSPPPPPPPPPKVSIPSAHEASHASALAASLSIIAEHKERIFPKEVQVRAYLMPCLALPGLCLTPCSCLALPSLIACLTFYHIVH